MRWRPLTNPPGKSARPPVLYTIPKKVVRLATQRNRLRRLFKEAVRMDPFFSNPDTAYHFRVLRFPGPVGLADVRECIRRIRVEETR